jgi:hypothetical protein
MTTARFSEGPEGRAVSCGSCGYRFGGFPSGGPFRFEDSLRRLEDAEDGRPRYGLRQGALLKGGRPERRSVVAGLLATVGKKGREGFRPQRPPQLPRGDVGPKFYAYCLNCGATNFVDLTLLQPAE